MKNIGREDTRRYQGKDTKKMKKEESGEDKKYKE